MYRILKISFSFAVVFVFFGVATNTFAALSCSVSATCTSPAVVIMQLSGSTNAHAELPGGLNYLLNNVCCTGVTGLGNSCSGTYGVVAKLSGTTNAEIEQNSQSNYANNVCMSDTTSGDSVTIAYQSTNCSGYDTTVASMSSVTGAHAGDASAYTTKICASIAQQSITFSNDDVSIGFGPLTTANARYATGDTLGSGTDSTAHTLAISTNAASGYNLTYVGATLTSGANTIPVATITSDADGAPATSQFAIDGTLTGTGTMVSAYNHTTPNWKFVAGATTTLASAVAPAASDSVAVHYLANVAANQAPGIYTNTITYIATGNF